MSTQFTDQVLVSGASFAGLCTAFWMSQLGFRVKLIEVANGLRRGGTPVDIEGEALIVLERMKIIDAVQAQALAPRKLFFKEANDDTIGSVGVSEHLPNAHDNKYEIHRDDLLDILFGQIENSVEVVFDESIKQIDQENDYASVVFANGSSQKYRFVFGCDGNRSNTRRLVFGNDKDFSFFMGGYFFIKVVDENSLLSPDTSEIFSVPGRTALLNGYHDQTDIAFAFRAEKEIDYDYRDRAQQRYLIHRHFDGLPWKVSKMLNYIDADDNFYFDKLNQIRMPSWSLGRVVLVGDAGYSVSPLAGMGGSMAIIGASRLHSALEQYGDDHHSAFQNYYDNLHPVVDEIQKTAALVGLATMFPNDENEINARNLKLQTNELLF